MKATHYGDITLNDKSVTSIITEVMENPDRLMKIGTNRDKESVIDIFSPKTGRGVRLKLETLEFDTFVNIK